MVLNVPTSRFGAKLKEIVVDGSHLAELTTRPRLWDYVRDCWRMRAFTLQHARSLSLLQGRGTFLGRTWIVLDPLLQVAIYVLVFGLIMEVDRGIDNFIGFLMVGVMMFRSITRSFSAAVGLIQRSRGLITSFNFPTAELVFSASIRNFIDNIAPVMVGICVALVSQLDTPIGFGILWFVPVSIIALVFQTGAMFFIARATAFVPDLRGLVTLAIRALFFISGIFYTLDRFDSHPQIRAVMEMNPVYQFLRMSRLAILESSAPPMGAFAMLSAFSMMTLILGFVYFWRAEGRYSSVR